MDGQTEYLPQVMKIENICKIMVGKHSGKAFTWSNENEMAV
jgi:hypothetical protein